MTKSETGVYRFDAYFTAGNAPEIRVNTVLRADYYPAYALAADGRIVTLNSAADAVPAGPAIDIDGMRTLTIDLNAMTYTLSRIAIANCMPDDAAAACPSKAFRTKDGGVKIWMTRNLNWNGGPEIGASGAGLFRLGDVGRLRSPRPLHRAQSRLRRRGERRIGQGRSGRHGPSRTSLYAR